MLNESNRSPALPGVMPVLRVAEFSLWLAYAVLLAVALGLLYRTVLVDMAHAQSLALERHAWLKPVLLVALCWSVPVIALLLFKTWLWLHYRPVPPLEPANAPPLTVVIPAYNEGAMIEKTIDSVAASLYRPERLQIVVVDDGSRDDTWEYIERAALRYGDRVEVVRFERNQGKRAALMEGFRRARGEVVVTIDSDSVIGATTLLAMAAPFVDSRVGAVAGKVSVHNLNEGLIPRMLRFAYALSFDFQRAAESQFRTVYCSPGALAAYRTAALREVQDRWMAQTFLGSPCTFGEDRALTNYLLEKGFDSVYQGNAEVRTLVPTTYARLCKMFLRWNRSFVREELRLARIVWRRPLRYRLMVLWDKLTTNLRYPIQYASLVALVVLLAEDLTLLPLTALGIALGTLPFMLFYLRSERSWAALYGLPYAFFSMLALSWILPYALLTPRARSWLTR
jgi:hyaluronan synthase